MDAQLQIRLLGEFALSLGGSPVSQAGISVRGPAYSGRRLQSLLVYLLLHHDAPQSRQYIAFLSWPDSSEDQALANLRTLLFHLRHNFPFVEPYIKIERNTLQWCSDASLEIDMLQFEQALTEAEHAGHRGDTRTRIELLQKAIELYKGDLLPSFYEDWIVAERERLQQRFTNALEALIALFEQQGNLQAAISAAQRLLRHNPLHEAIYTRLMELYAASGMVPEALRVYHTCATTLERELGVAPGTSTREVYERLLTSRQPARIRTTQYQTTEPHEPPAVRGPLRGGDPAQAPNSTPPIPSEPIPRGLGTRQEVRDEPSVRNRSTLEQPALRVATPLTGRATEWEMLQEAWREATQGGMRSGARAVLIRGEAGIGKTRLAEELFNWVARQGVAVAGARCYPIERQLAFGPVADWLRALPIPRLAPVWLSEVARLRPGILEESPDIPAPGPLTEAWQRRRFIEAISRMLLANQPLLLTLDDLQWCDLDTLEYLHFLMRAPKADPHDTGTRALLVMTARIEEIDTVPDAARADYLAHLLDGLRDTDRLLEMDLMPLSQEDTGELAAALSGDQGLDSPRISELYRETEGNPLFIVEMLRTGWLQQMRKVEPGIGTSTLNRDIPHAEGLPPRIARVLKARLGQLSTVARDLVDVAAVIGRDFTLPLLVLAGNESENRVVQAIDEMWRRRIVREQGEDGYDFSHDKLRQAAYSTLTAAKRRMLHRAAARALEELYAGRLNLVYAQLGMHHEIAGTPLAAARYYRQGAEAAVQLYANAEAILLYERAFALAEQLRTIVSESEAEEAIPAQGEALKDVIEVGENLGNLLEMAGNHVRARSIYERVLGFCPQSRLLWRARLLLKIGDTWRSQRDWSKTIEFYDTSDKVLGDEPYAPDEQWWDQWIEAKLSRMMLHYWLSDPIEMQEIAGKMQPVIERQGSRLQKVNFYRRLASMHLRLDRYVTSDECLRYAAAALEETKELNSLTEMTDSTFLKGFCFLWRGDYASAVDYIGQALTLAERTGETDFKLLSLNYLAVAYRMQGDVQRVRDTVARHIEFMDSVQMPSYSEAAEANLAWIAWKEGDLATAKRHATAAREKFPEQESFTWLVTWPLVAVNLAEGNLSDAVSFAAAQLAPSTQRAPEELIAAVRAAVEAWGKRLSDQAADHLRHAVELAQECRYL